MIIEDIAGFVAILPANRAIAGLDFGDKTIGVAISDLRRSVATPIEVIRRVKFTVDAAALLALCTARGVHGLILGLPAWSTDGTQTAGASNTIAEYTGTAWKVSRGSSYSATKTSAAATPDGLTSWTVGTGVGGPTIAAFAVPTPPVITA